MKKTAKQPAPSAAKQPAANNKASTLDGYYNVSAEESEIMLLLPSNKVGTYLIRPNTYPRPAGGPPIQDVLSLKVSNEMKANYNLVEHWSIDTGNNGRCSIETDSSFATVLELLGHYRGNKGSLGCKLTVPCPKESAPVDQLDAEVNRECIRLGEKTHSGNTFDGHFATWDYRIRVAVKIMKDKRQTAAYPMILQEGNILLKLSNPHIIRFLGMCTTPGPLYIIFEPMENGRLSDLVMSDCGETLNMKHVLDMAIQIAIGMDHMGSRRIIHRDLSASHVLVAPGNQVKIAHFGLARELDKGKDCFREAPKFSINDTSSPREGHMAAYMPLEAAYDGVYSVKSDVWAYGVVLWEIVSGSISLGHLLGYQILDELDKGYRLPMPEKRAENYPIECDTKLHNIMKECWRDRPDKRPTFAQLKEQLTDYAAKCQPKPLIPREKVVDPRGG